MVFRKNIIILTIFSCLLVLSCQNQPSQTGVQRNRATAKNTGQLDKQVALNNTDKDNTNYASSGDDVVYDYSDGQDNSLDPNAHGSDYEAQQNEKDSACKEADKVKDIEIKISGQVLDIVDVSDSITLEEKELEKVAKMDDEFSINEESSQPNLPSKIPSQMVMIKSVENYFYPKTELLPYPKGTYKITFYSYDGTSSVSVVHEEKADDELFAGNGYRKKFTVDASKLRISEIDKITVEKAAPQFQVDDLCNGVFTACGNEKLMQFLEFNRFKLDSITITINTIKIYSKTEINHALVFKPEIGGPNSRESNISHFSYSWSDRGVANNNLMSTYRAKYTDCR